MDSSFTILAITGTVFIIIISILVMLILYYRRLRKIQKNTPNIENLEKPFINQGYNKIAERRVNTDERERKDDRAGGNDSMVRGERTTGKYADLPSENSTVHEQSDKNFRTAERDINKRVRRNRKHFSFFK